MIALCEDASLNIAITISGVIGTPLYSTYLPNSPIEILSSISTSIAINSLLTTSGGISSGASL
jgi:hypothetical protein